MALTTNSMDCNGRLLQCMNRTERAEKELAKLILDLRKFVDSDEFYDLSRPDMAQGIREIIDGH